MRLPSHRISLTAVAGSLLLATGMGAVFAGEDHDSQRDNLAIGPADDGPQRQTVTAFVERLTANFGRSLRLVLPRGNKIFVRVRLMVPTYGTTGLVGNGIIVDDSAPF